MLVKNEMMRSVAGASVVVAGVTVLAACGGSTSATTSTSPTAAVSASASVSVATSVNTGPHNQEDVVFLQGMIPHHDQAIVMAKLVPSHTTNQALIALAAKIEGAQAPEIALMTSWLSQWQVSVSPTAGGQEMSGHDMGTTHGMMTADQLSRLEKAQGAQFDKMWLTMMIEHHEGAVVMAKQELAKGENPQSKELAQTIIDGQTQEINQMKQMLNS